MRKRLLSALIAVMVTATGVMVPFTTVKADPGSSVSVNSQTQQLQSQLNEMLNKINELNEKIQVLDNEISPLDSKIKENNKEIENVTDEIANTNKEIEQAKADIEEQEEVLGQRLRELYKSGGQTSYISLIFSAESFSDLISKIDAASKLIKIDQKIANELTNTKKNLDNKVESLESKAKEIETLTEEVKVKKAELDEKKADQEVILTQAKAEQEAFESQYLVPQEMSEVSPWIEQATNSNNSVDDIKNSKSMLEAYLQQLKSDEAKSSVNNAISKANALIDKKNKEAEEVKKAATTNRGDDTLTVSKDMSGLMTLLRAQLGKSYVYGANGPSTFDCSGLTSYVYRNALGIEIGRTTYEQINSGVEVSQSELKPGDLVFPHPGHVAIYIGNGQMIHAPQTGDVVKISSVYKFWRARRIVKS